MLLSRPCPLCGQNDARLWFDPPAPPPSSEPCDYAFQPPVPPGPVVRCRACGLVYVNPIQRFGLIIQDGPTLCDRPPRLLDSADLSDIRDNPEEPVIEAYMSELESKQVNARNALARLHTVSKTRGRLLDIGCYCGVFLNEAVQQGWEGEGLEPSVMHAIHARGRFGLRVVTDSLRDSTFLPEYFDVVTAFQVIEHLVEPVKALAIVHRILKPGGLVMIEAPNIDNLWVRVMGSRHRHFVDDHVSYFTPRTLAILLSRAGFQPQKIFYPARTLRLAHLLQWVGRYTGRALKNRLDRGLSLAHIESNMLRVNLHDIVTIIAQKT